MIIICAGDSFTYGSELWEEKNIVDYTKIKKAEDAYRAISKLEYEERKYTEFCTKFLEGISTELIIGDTTRALHSLMDYSKKLNESQYNIVFNRETERQYLTYVHLLSKKLNCKTVNLGKGGSSQIDTIHRLISFIRQQTKLNQSQKIICILQNTTTNRIWIGKNNKNESMILSNFGLQNKADATEDYEILNIYMKYCNGVMVMPHQFTMQTLFANYFCRENNIQFISFDAWMKHESLECYDFNINIGASTYLNRYYNGNNFSLPGGHFNCESHEVIADWLIAEMKKRGII